MAQIRFGILNEPTVTITAGDVAVGVEIGNEVPQAEIPGSQNDEFNPPSIFDEFDKLKKYTLTPDKLNKIQLYQKGMAAADQLDGDIQALANIVDDEIERLFWRAPIGWSSLIVIASSASGPSERCFRARADDSPMSCAA